MELWNRPGHSVLEVVNAFERVAGVTVPLIFVPRRLGDIARCWADASKAERQLHWTARFSLELMLEDAWRWQCECQNERQERT